MNIVVAAAGSPGIVTPDMIKPGAAVVAAGTSFEGKKVISDVDERVAEVAGWLSPRLGGVGPMTRAMLLANVVETAERQLSLRGAPSVPHRPSSVAGNRYYWRVT